MAALVTTAAPGRVLRAVRTRWFRLATRVVVGVGVLIALVAHVGTGPFLRGLLSLDGRTVLASLVLTAIATTAAAWRWRIVAGRLGVAIPWSTAIGMCYRAQFLNTVLPGGVVGDVHRAISHGRQVENLQQASRAVAIERIAGQAVQLALTVVLILGFGARFGGWLLIALATGIAVAIAAVMAARVSLRLRRALLHEIRELRVGLGSGRVGLQVVLASTVAVACHTATFAIAASAVGAEVPPQQLLVLALVVLLGASIPLNIGGWGPREGIAGWAFALAGFGASAGIAASTLFGILVMISVAPGGIVALVGAARRRTPRASSPPILIARSRETTS